MHTDKQICYCHFQRDIHFPLEINDGASATIVLAPIWFIMSRRLKKISQGFHFQNNDVKDGDVETILLEK